MATQRALDKTETMKARAEAVDELQRAGTFEGLTALGPGQDEVDRQLDQLGAKSAVYDEFARLKAACRAAVLPLRRWDRSSHLGPPVDRTRLTRPSPPMFSRRPGCAATASLALAFAASASLRAQRHGGAGSLSAVLVHPPAKRPLSGAAIANVSGDRLVALRAFRLQTVRKVKA